MKENKKSLLNCLLEYFLLLGVGSQLTYIVYYRTVKLQIAYFVSYIIVGIIAYILFKRKIKQLNDEIEELKNRSQ